MSYSVTITRQFGSLGRPIAKCLSEMLEIEYYDRDIVEATAKKMGLPVSVGRGEGQKQHSFRWEILSEWELQLPRMKFLMNR